MGRKPRTKKQHYPSNGKCGYFDHVRENGIAETECMLPWSMNCTGNIHNCVKLRYHHLASISDKQRDYIGKNIQIKI
jgi:hypothetical protein